MNEKWTESDIKVWLADFNDGLPRKLVIIIRQLCDELALAKEHIDRLTEGRMEEMKRAERIREIVVAEEIIDIIDRTSGMEAIKEVIRAEYGVK